MPFKTEFFMIIP